MNTAHADRRSFRLPSLLLASLLVVVIAAPHHLQADGAWSADTAVPAALSEVAVAALNGVEYVAGGSSSTGPVNTLYAFDAATHVWQARAPYPGPARDHMGLVGMDGFLYLAGGLSGLPGPSVSSFQRYDPTTNTWTALAPLPSARAAFGMAAVDGRIIIVGGIVSHDDPDALADVSVYDPTTNAWQQATPLPTPRDHVAAAALSGKLYVVGGRPGGDAICTPFAVTEVYDPLTGTWSTGPALAAARAGHALTVANGRIQAIGGDGAASTCGPTAAVEEFVPSAGAWRLLTPMPQPRYGIGAASIGGLIYIPAGKVEGGTRTTAHDRLDPAVPAPPSGALPAPWISRDIGAVGLSGSASESAGTFTVRGAGADIWGTADAFHLMSQPIAGDGSLTARITSLTNTHPYAKAGLMFRGTLAADAPHVILDVTPGGNIEFMTRATAGGSTSYLTGAVRSLPVWVRLARAGSTFVASTSTDGITWAQLGQTSVALPATAYAGAAVTSHSPSTLTTAALDSMTVVGEAGNLPPSVTLTAPTSSGVYSSLGSISLAAQSSDTDGTVARVEFNDGATLVATDTSAPYTATLSSPSVGAHSLTAVATDNSGNRSTSSAVSISVVAPATSGLPAPFASWDVGAVGRAGGASVSGGTFTVRGAGADVWGGVDGFHFVFQPLTGDGRIVARLHSLQNTHVFAKAGVMFRQSLGSSDVHALLDVRPTGDVEYLTRRSPGADTDVYGSGFVSFPEWLRLTRTGNTFTAETSNDATSWSFVGTVVLPMPETAYVGLVVSSHSTDTIATATFSDVSVTSISPPPPSALTFTTRGLAHGGLHDGGSYGISEFFGPTSLQVGPDGRLYVATITGMLYALTLDPATIDDPTRVGVLYAQAIDSIYRRPSRTCNVGGDPNVCTTPSGEGRQVTGITVRSGNAPGEVVLYVSHSAPSLSATADTTIDTRSGTITRLTLAPATDTPEPNDLRVAALQDLVVGLPRSVEAHTINGLSVGPDEWLYLAVGGHTNAGQPSQFFGNLPEYYLSASVVRLNLAALGTRSLPLDVSGVSSDALAAPLAGVFELFATGYRNAYDLTWHSNGRLYLNDNAANFSEGNTPGAADGCATPSISPGNRPDDLNLVTAGAYGGHPNPSRGECVFDDGTLYVPSLAPHPDLVRPLLSYDNGSSTNGIVEYTADTFGGAMKGNLVSATYAGNQNVRRVVLDSTGTSVVREENLGQFAQPLDVTTDPAGRIYVAEYGGNRITVLLPGQLGTCPVPGADPATTDSDGDGYMDADEQANGTGICSPASKPADFDADRVSDLTDADDDNDGIVDGADQLFFDAQNGSATSIPLAFEYDPTSPPAGGVANTGFTGAQIASTGPRLDTAAIKAGDAGGHMSMTTAAGTAESGANSQVNALQLGLDASSAFHVWTELVQPFTTTAPASGHVGGVFFGPDQDHFFRVALVGVSGSRTLVQAGLEVSGTFTSVGAADITSTALASIDLHLVGDPSTHTLTAYYEVNHSGTLALVARNVAAPSAWFSDNAGAARNASLAGLMTSHGSANQTGFGFAFFRVDRVIPAPPPPPSAPGAPSGPFPTNGAQQASIATPLAWASATGAASYDVALGTSNPPPPVASGVTDTTFQPALLAYGTTYFWRVTARNTGGATDGPVWQFTTDTSPPPPPPASTTLRRLRVLTWDVNGGRDRSGALNADAQVSLLARSGAQVIVLQGVTATTSGDLFAYYAQRLTEMTGTTWNRVAVEDPRAASDPVQGNLVLTRLPIADAATALFDAAPSQPGAVDAKRSAARVSVIVNGVPVTVATSHLATDAQARQLQLDQLQAWLASAPLPRLLGVNLSAPPSDQSYGDMSQGHDDLWAQLVQTTDQGSTTWDAATGQQARMHYWWQAHNDTRTRATEVWVIKTARSPHHAVVAEMEVR